MATTNPGSSINQPSKLCDYCHQKPKFSNHSYCSKTCAGQAATLCSNCHKKPKFQGFEYCGKNCAALANPGGGKARQPGAGSAQLKKAPLTQSNNHNTQQQQQPSTAPAPPFDPIQIAKLVAQHIPQVQALLAPAVNNSTVASPQPAGQPTYLQPANNTSNNAYHAQVPMNNPFIDPAYQVSSGTGTGTAGTAVTNGAVNLTTSSNLYSGAQQLHISTQQPANNIECLIPGCGNPVHVDAKGVKISDYCSMRHREEAVSSGLVSPCIMCLMLPQSDTDYFCSRGCREESMQKLDYENSDQDDSDPM